jgi:hypothetical protein
MTNILRKNNDFPSDIAFRSFITLTNHKSGIFNVKQRCSIIALQQADKLG